MAKCVREQKAISVYRDVKPLSADWHAKRVAHFVLNDWDGTIEVDIGVPSLRAYSDWPVQDGNHRLAAAIFKGTKKVPIAFSGSIAYAEKIFGKAFTRQLEIQNAQLDATRN